MNLLSTNIYLNCIRLLKYNEAYITYICITACSTSTLHILKNQFHLLVYSGGWFFYLQTSGGSHKGKVCACTALATYFYSHGAARLEALHADFLTLTSVAFFRFRVSESGHRYAHKTPSLATFQSKNSTPENSPQCMQCPEPDNMRPCKAIFAFIGESLVRNSSLSLGRLVYCTGKMLVCDCPRVLQGGRGYN